MDNAEVYKKKAIKYMIICIFGIILMGASLFGAFRIIKDNDKASNIVKETMSKVEKSESYKIVSTKTTSGAITAVNDVSKTAEEVLPSIVAITETSVVTQYIWGYSYSQEVSGSGSGVIIKEDDDFIYIVTNNHVVEGAKKIEIQFINEDVVEAAILGTNSNEDLAVVVVKKSDISEETYKAIKVINLGDSDKLRVGENVVAIGNALGYGISVTEGYVSAKDRVIDIEDYNMTLIQTDAAINPGNSGGALVDTEGKLVGINSAKLADEEIEGMGYAIPINRAMDVIAEFTKDGAAAGNTSEANEPGFLGVTGMIEVTDEDNEQLGYPIGIYIGEVIEGCAAQKSGMINGDIITKVNDRELKTITELSEYIATFEAGTTVKVEVMRAYDGEFKKVELDVTLTSKAEYEESISEETEEEPDAEGSFW